MEDDWTEWSENIWNTHKQYPYPYRQTAEAWAKAISLIGSSDKEGKISLNVAHDTIYIGPNGNTMELSAVDAIELYRLGFNWDREYGCWRRYT